MKRSLLNAIFLMLGMFLTGSAFAAAQSVEKPANCDVCGMDRISLAASRVVITYSNKSVVGTCSIHCAHKDVASKKTLKVESIQVADHDTRELIDAKKAFWVIGGREPGIMSNTAKSAFAERERAEAFIKLKGGLLAGFEAVWKAAVH
jgi:nitrous oxide reductase accessory protein NosL